jgi:hypothetical protein
MHFPQFSDENCRIPMRVIVEDLQSFSSTSSSHDLVTLPSRHEYQKHKQPMVLFKKRLAHTQHVTKYATTILRS